MIAINGIRSRKTRIPNDADSEIQTRNFVYQANVFLLNYIHIFIYIYIISLFFNFVNLNGADTRT